MSFVLTSVHRLLILMLAPVLACRVCADNSAASQLGSSGIMGGRFLTLNTVIRVKQIEVSRKISHGPDESSVPTSALSMQYGKNLRWLPPKLKEAKAADAKLVLQFDTTVIPFHDVPIQGFAIAGKDGRFQPAKAQWIDKNAGKNDDPNWDRTTIVLFSSWVQEPLYFRYAWARNPLESVRSNDLSGLPFDTQRKDTWSLADMYENYTGKKTKTPDLLQRNEHNELLKALREADLQCRAAEAKEVLKSNQAP